MLNIPKLGYEIILRSKVSTRATCEQYTDKEYVVSIL